MSAASLRAASLLGALLVACGGPEATITPVAEVAVGPDLAPNRPFRRMNVDQLAASMEAVSGVAWTEQEDGETVRLFDRLSGSLGKPDYLSSTYEEQAPGLLFQKFLDDAAKATCAAWMDVERTAPSSERRLLQHVDPSATVATDPTGIRQDLASAMLRFHGTVVDAASPALDPWVTLFDRAATTSGDPMDGWRVVCIGLYTHPDFYTY